MGIPFNLSVIHCFQQHVSIATLLCDCFLEFLSVAVLLHRITATAAAVAAFVVVLVGSLLS